MEELSKWHTPIRGAAPPRPKGVPTAHRHLEKPRAPSDERGYSLAEGER